ncbi:MAG: hypothetical protein LBI44_04145, partial [Oscillospiraceae bacterium]|nr:hypothetical protein [Oscillospiraceae bacterium]
APWGEYLNEYRCNVSKGTLDPYPERPDNPPAGYTQEDIADGFRNYTSLAFDVGTGTTVPYSRKIYGEDIGVPVGTVYDRYTHTEA